jgi:uncharacterized membrane protein YhaH (DUF805 family)
MKNPSRILFPSKIGRVSFLIRYVVLLVTAGIAVALMQISDRTTAGIKIGLCVGVIVLLILVLICLFRAILNPRLRDMGLHTAFALLIFVPIINLIFLLGLLFLPPGTFAKGNATA